LNRSNLDTNGTGIEKVIRDIDNHIEAGFQLAVFQGPLCAEPVEGLAYFVEQIDVDKVALEKEIGKFNLSFML
jgi:ribosome assembly protein 1